MGFDASASIEHDYVPLFDDPYLQMSYDGLKVGGGGGEDRGGLLRDEVGM